MVLLVLCCYGGFGCFFLFVVVVCFLLFISKKTEILKHLDAKIEEGSHIYWD